MNESVSVCMAIKNGSRFIRKQIDSILPQLSDGDEFIFSDDHSDDDTLSLVRNYGDHRIKVVTNPSSGLVSNFQHALTLSSGSHIFLADQDDIWHAQKIQIMKGHLKTHDLVICDCQVADENLEPIHESFFELNKSKRGIVRNLIKNSYMGCCMAFNRNVLEMALPFPAGIPMHDLWIGLQAEKHFNVKFISDKLVTHRRHGLNASSTSSMSNFNLQQKLTGRLALIKNLIYAN
jgi:glycosyltransferase involved in cell wall biosynthesis